MNKILSWLMGLVLMLPVQTVLADDMGKMEGMSAPVAHSTPAGKHKAKKTSKKKAVKDVYACPMGHYTGDKPGKCPKCGMDLVKQEKVEKKPEKKAPAESKMDMSGNKFKTVSAEKFGVGENAKICPVSGDEIEPGKGTEATLSNGKKIMMCCPRCQKAIEKNLKKYSSLMY